MRYITQLHTMIIKCIAYNVVIKIFVYIITIRICLSLRATGTPDHGAISKRLHKQPLCCGISHMQCSAVAIALRAT